MTFAKKLDLLMNITNTSNSVLARNICIDASFISRLRRGVRTPAKNVTYLKSMVEYFVRNCRADYQKAALWEAIKSTSQIKPLDNDPLETILYRWLCEKADSAIPTNSIDDFLDGVVHFQFRKVELAESIDIDKLTSTISSEVEVFYGSEGKQQAVLAFLSLVLRSDDPQTLLLYSDEDMGWLTDNHDYTAKWATLLLQVLKRGNRIKIIHNVNRSFDEMLAAIKEWVPIYMTGSIEPYYYPKTRDGLFRRTLFIAPGTSAAVASSSVGSGTKNAANFLLTNHNAVSALIEEYHDFLYFCRPLMYIFTPYNKTDYLSLLTEFEEEEANTIIKTDTLSSITMPVSLVESILTRVANPNLESLLYYQEKRTKQFHLMLEKYSFVEIVPLPDIKEILAGNMLVNFSDMLNDSQIFYTPEEYHQHLQGILFLLKNFNNYSIHLSRSRNIEGSLIYVREDVGVLVGKTWLPTVIFAINESNMKAAFWDYMNLILKSEKQNRFKREQTIAELEALSAKLSV